MNTHHNVGICIIYALRLIIAQARDGQARQPLEHLALERRVHVELARRVEDRHARVAPLVDDVALVREVRRAARRVVRVERVPHQPREHPLVARRARAVVDRRVVHVHDHAVGEERARGRRNRLDEVGGELGVDLRGERRRAGGVRLECRVRHLRTGGAGEGSGGDAITGGLACCATVRDEERREREWGMGRRQRGRRNLHSAGEKDDEAKVGADVRSADDEIRFRAIEELRCQGLDPEPCGIDTAQYGKPTAAKHCGSNLRVSIDIV